MRHRNLNMNTHTAGDVIHRLFHYARESWYIRDDTAVKEDLDPQQQYGKLDSGIHRKRPFWKLVREYSGLGVSPVTVIGELRSISGSVKAVDTKNVSEAGKNWQSVPEMHPQKNWNFTAHISMV